MNYRLLNFLVKPLLFLSERIECLSFVNERINAINTAIKEIEYIESEEAEQEEDYQEEIAEQKKIVSDNYKSLMLTCAIAWGAALFLAVLILKVLIGWATAVTISAIAFFKTHWLISGFLFLGLLYLIAFLIERYLRSKRGVLADEQKIQNYIFLSGIVCNALVPVADVLGLKPPSDKSEIESTTGARFYMRGSDVRYIFTCYKTDITEEARTKLIKATLNGRIEQIFKSGKLPVILEGVGFTCPIKVMDVINNEVNVTVEVELKAAIS